MIEKKLTYKNKISHFLSKNGFFIYIMMIFILLSVSSCNKTIQTEKPSDLIPYNQMIDITTQAYVIESMLYFLPPDSDKVTISRSMYYNMFEENKISKEQYVSSINYYLAEKKSAEKFLRAVQDKISIQRDKYFENLNISYDSLTQHQPQLDTLP